MSTATDERAERLAAEASELLSKGELQAAGQRLKEAISIAPGNTGVKAIFNSVRDETRKGPLINLCECFVEKRDSAAGEEAIKYVASQQISREDAEACIKLLPTSNEHFEVTDRLLGGLLSQSAAKCFLAGQLEKEPTATIRMVLGYGSVTLEGAITVLLDPTVWTSRAKQVQAQRDSFQLLMAQLLRAGQDDSEQVMRSIARLLATHPDTFKDVVDRDTFDPVLSSLDIRLSAGLRSQATLAAAKLLEVSPESGEQAFIKFVTSRVTKQTTDHLTIGFSAAAAMFPVVPSTTSSLFLTQGFLEQLVSIIRTRSQSTKLEKAALELLNAACMDKGCREAIAKHCTDWLREIVDKGSDAERAGLAAVILVKTGTVIATSEAAKKSKDPSDLVAMFQKTMLEPEPSTRQSATEGLAFTSLQPKVKEVLANDSVFLKNLISTLTDFTSEGPLILGGLTIFANLTTYLPPLSEEQRNMSQLRAYANATKPQEADPIDDDNHVTSRCKKVLAAGIVPLLVRCSKSASPMLLFQIVTILFNLSHTPKNRPVLAQRGAVKLLVTIYDSLPTSSTNPSIQQTLQKAAHALARTLISVDPSLAFTSSLHITSAIRPLASLLAQEIASGLAESNSSRSLLPTFEALLALTNLASAPDGTPREQIISNHFTLIEDLLLSSNTAIQRAATELICNLCASSSCIALLTPSFPTSSSTSSDTALPTTQSKDADAKRRLHILLALCDAEDLNTRKAAGGAVAMISEYGAGVDGILARERGVRVLVDMCEDESEEVVWRGVVCARNIVCVEGRVGERGREAVRREGGVQVLRSLLKKTRNPDLMEAGVEALERLV